METGGSLSVLFVCTHGPLQGRTFKLDGGPLFIFGRYSRAHFDLSDDPAISHLHFIVDVSDNHVRIADLGSTNGLMVNLQRFGRRSGATKGGFIDIKHGDAILAGSSLLRLVVNNAPLPIPSRTLTTTRIVSASREAGDGSIGLTTIMRREDEEKLFNSPEKIALGQSPELLPVISGYTILSYIGGSEATGIFKAIKDDSGATVAVKILRSSLASGKRTAMLQLFNREKNVMRRLHHSNIIRYMGEGLTANNPYFAMEYAGGGNLAELIAREEKKGLALDRSIPLFIQLLEAVIHMHDAFLVHRDIRPRNILLDPRRGGGMAVKLSNPKFACCFSNHKEGDFPPINHAAETPAYMAPEQLSNLTMAIPQSDVFSCAAVFFELLTGTTAYDSPESDHTAARPVRRIRPINSVHPDLDPRLKEIIDRALSFNPENRQADAREFLDTLRESLS
ncbi:MAG: protein kinase [Planctomycetota bacterium]|nr:protein kinase [Planctomycetota bacterium]